ncbi:MAG: hypothetical protein HOP08_19930 [Cyclobacteriaceae bacterium]|nr:hypothetical protein [Cyclobacteriaceae bacterium]
MNYLIHSEKHGRLTSELDIIGIRFPFHSQKDRKVETSPFLEASLDRIEVMIADVKGGEIMKFNEALTKELVGVQKMLSWIGIFTEEELVKYDSIIQNELIAVSEKPIDRFRFLDIDLKSGRYRIKFIIINVNAEMSKPGELKYLHGEEVLSYCWECLRLNEVVDTCSRRYNYENWGNEYEGIVRYFKSREENHGTIKAFYDHFKSERLDPDVASAMST